MVGVRWPPLLFCMAAKWFSCRLCIILDASIFSLFIKLASLSVCLKPVSPLVTPLSLVTSAVKTDTLIL
jgi:hypothetical protein